MTHNALEQTLQASLTCQQSDCSGAISDGYCDICGLAAGKSASASVPSGASSSKVHTQSSARYSRRTSARTSARTSQRMSSRRSDRHRLGLGLVSLPDLPSNAPETLVLDDPKVPENKRFCGHCDARVRRDRGFCSQCGSGYSFIPSLKAGDVVGAQYEVRGAIAYGGLGWIYLAFDQLLSRYVVLKGLLNSEDASSAAVALAERQFLAAVKQPNIVGVYNFVTHGGEGFIVMEYVAGQTLRDLRRRRGPLPVSEAIAYIHRILGAFSYLHGQGLVYCDFKPDNVMLEDGDVKLIDMGAVRRIDDPEGDIYGTVGYSAPEAGEGPTPASDLFTVGRTLAVLVATIPDFRKTHRFTLPGPDQIPLFGQYESLYHFLQRATAQKAGERFQSAEEMAEQLFGILRQVVAQETGQEVSAGSQFFGQDPLALGNTATDFSSGTSMTGASSSGLPMLLVDESDPAYGAVMNALAMPDRESKLTQLQQIAPQLSSKEATLNQIRLFLEAGDTESLALARQKLQGHFHTNLQNHVCWRSQWYCGQYHLHHDRPKQAQRCFKRVYHQLPGELIPQLVLAQVLEQQEQFERARELYERVWQTDRRYPSAVFGLGRCCTRLGDSFAAAEALAEIPAASPLYSRSRWEIAQTLLVQRSSPLNLTELERIAHLLPPPINALSPGLSKPQSLLQPKGHRTNAATGPRSERAVRIAIERSLRSLAQSRQPPHQRLTLTELANQIRPRTWF